MMDYFQILCGIAVLLLSIYYYFSSTYDYWKKRDIPGPQPTIIIGNFTDVILRRLSIGDTLIKFYNEYKNEPVFGLFEGSLPVLVINNMDMIKDILIKDFSVFVDRGFRIFPKIEKLGENLFLLEPERWRPMRAKLSPIFTSGKLKDMFPLLIECAGHLEKYMDSVIITEESTDCRELTAKFTTDVIGSCVFGINMNALSEEESEFRRMGRKLFAPSFKQVIRETFRQFMPYLYEVFGQYLQPKEVDNFFVNVVKDTMNYRKENNIVRPDFIHMLMELKKHPEKLEKI
ncbi:PREDICTED: cytochrome P450 6A1-like, partial [Habropoda laboriosa]|uniref:cytochrome P450 6A1-like n=1 Tax=Habropoda laboriosa TaxID=597456 RepID=UPI00083CD1FE